MDYEKIIRELNTASQMTFFSKEFRESCEEAATIIKIMQRYEGMVEQVNQQLSKKQKS